MSLFLKKVVLATFDVLLGAKPSQDVDVLVVLVLGRPTIFRKLTSSPRPGRRKCPSLGM